MTAGAARYDRMFDRLSAASEGAFVPFLMLGYPSLEASVRLAGAAVEAGADALELGIPFSDPTADGPVIQAAATRALANGTTVAHAWSAIRELRARHSDPPIGLLVYANLVVAAGLDPFYREAARSGADSVLVADLPLAESGPFVTAAHRAGVSPVFIAPPNASPGILAAVARAGRGYTYVVARSGVTGADRRLAAEAEPVLLTLARLGAPPPLLGFGISEPGQVRRALELGARGAIVGSALVSELGHPDRSPDDEEAVIRGMVRDFKAATRASPVPTGKP